jgi:hypothetical protein
MTPRMERDEARELSDAELVELRGGISRLTGALLRAWWLGMAVARNPEQQKLFDEICATVGRPTERGQEGDATPLALRVEPTDDEENQSEVDEMTPISDEEYLQIIGPLLARYKMLRLAYLRGMFTASTPEQEHQLGAPGTARLIPLRGFEPRFPDRELPLRGRLRPIRACGVRGDLPSSVEFGGVGDIFGDTPSGPRIDGWPTTFKSRPVPTSSEDPRR